MHVVLSVVCSVAVRTDASYFKPGVDTLAMEPMAALVKCSDKVAFHKVKLADSAC
jgi:hypothetical protein